MKETKDKWHDKLDDMNIGLDKKKKMENIVNLYLLYNKALRSNIYVSYRCLDGWTEWADIFLRKLIGTRGGSMG